MRRIGKCGFGAVFLDIKITENALLINQTEL